MDVLSTMAERYEMARKGGMGDPVALYLAEESKPGERLYRRLHKRRMRVTDMAVESGGNRGAVEVVLRDAARGLLQQVAGHAGGLVSDYLDDMSDMDFAGVMLMPSYLRLL